ncbi:MAG: S8 family serine peptidase [Rubrivivax sp.]|nr:S8 family serine peptidase [Rubrivivax sp.]
MKSARFAALLLAALTPALDLPALAQMAPNTATSAARAPAALRAPLPPMAGEVIVGFKPGADLLRKHALAARSDAAGVKQVLADRAASLSQRVGSSLRAGSAVGADAMVMHADGVDADTLARQLRAAPDVAYAEPNGRKRIVAAPNDPLYPATAPGVRPSGPDSGQWYLRTPDNTIKSAINIEGAWARTTGSGSVVVAVLDTGTRYDHPDLSRRLLRGYDFVNDPAVGNDGDGRDADANDPGDWTTPAENSDPAGKFYKCDPAGTGQAEASRSSWHGTSTASLIGAAANTVPAAGMAGAANGVRVLPVRVLGKCFGSDGDILAGMLWAAGISQPGVPDNPTPANVLNMSLGGTGICKPNYQAVVDQIIARGVSIVAAAGNTAGGQVNEPANCRGVVGVLALRHAGTKVGFSDLGTEISIAAPGGNCINTAANTPCVYPILAAGNAGEQGPAAPNWTDSFRPSVGTSFSSPLVASVAALMLSRQPALTPAQLRSTLQSTARPFPTSGAETPGETVPVCRAPNAGVAQLQCYCTTAFCGAGMLDASAAVAAVSTAAPYLTITADPVTPTTGDAVTFTITGLQAQPASAALLYSWTLVDGGGAVNGFGSATNASTATLTPTGAGLLRVRLSLSDGSTAEQTVLVAAAPLPQPPNTPPAADSGGGGGGGGGSSAAWVAGVGLAAAVLKLLQLLQLRAVRRRRA